MAKNCIALCVAAGAAGCQLIGYEGFTLSEAGLDASHDAERSGTLDATHDAAVAAEDAQRDSRTQPAPDSGPLCSGSVNACGGCSTLSATLSASCGQCGLGRYGCEGTDSLVCNGGDALPRASAGALLLDDFEDGDDIPKAGWGADGYWFVYSDHSTGHVEPADGSRIVPASVGAAGTARSAHISGGGFTIFGAGLILWPNDKQCAFDLSTQRGIGFWLKGKSTLSISVATLKTVDKQYCGTACNDFHSKSYLLSNTWTHYTLPWSDLAQAGWGTPAAFNASQALYVQFSFGPNVNFELYLDELEFF